MVQIQTVTQYHRDFDTVYIFDLSVFKLSFYTLEDLIKRLVWLRLLLSGLTINRIYNKSIKEDIMNNDGRITDPNNRVITDDYLEVGDRERIIDDNERRLTGNDQTINNTVIRHENDNIIEDHDAIDRTAVKHMSKEARSDLNADPITGEPGSHPVGTGIGGIGGAAAGAAIGTMAGPLGTLIGGAIGAIVGGGAGHAAAEAIDPTREEAYWRAEYANADYYQEGHDFDRDLHPAYAVGYANRARYPADARFEDHESDLERSWNNVKGESRMEWNEARRASRDAWNRIS